MKNWYLTFVINLFMSLFRTSDLNIKPYLLSMAIQFTYQIYLIITYDSHQKKLYLSIEFFYQVIYSIDLLYSSSVLFSNSASKTFWSFNSASFSLIAWLYSSVSIAFFLSFCVVFSLISFSCLACLKFSFFTSVFASKSSVSFISPH